ncbi:MAG: hypothetical protein NTY32_11070 [Bacteroidia bacterium]|nr:hypothetical protein [Bacteroidia bacterium]
MKKRSISTSNTVNILGDNAPLTDNLDATYLGNPAGTLSKYSFSGRLPPPWALTQIEWPGNTERLSICPAFKKAFILLS